MPTVEPTAPQRCRYNQTHGVGANFWESSSDVREPFERLLGEADSHPIFILETFCTSADQSVTVAYIPRAVMN